jgi:hypothetical protein
MGKVRWHLVWALVAALALNPGGAQACAFHGYTPNPTLVDVLLATEQVALGEPVPGRLGQYRVVQTLAGPPLAEVEVPPGWRLKTSQKGMVLLARDGAYGHWLPLAVMEDRFAEVISQVMAQQSDWIYGDDGPRLRYFARLINDPDPQVRRLALQELDRVPYAALRAAPLPRVQDLRAGLTADDEALLPIRVLLAGLSKEHSLAGPLRRQMDEAVQRDLPYLGAYAVALIELEGKAGVQQIFEKYLTAGDLPESTQVRLVQALALQYRNGPRGTRRMIGREMAAQARQSPQLAGIAKQHFALGSRWRAPAGGTADEFVLER